MNGYKTTIYEWLILDIRKTRCFYFAWNNKNVSFLRKSLILPYLNKSKLNWTYIESVLSLIDEDDINSTKCRKNWGVYTIFFCS